MPPSRKVLDSFIRTWLRTDTYIGGLTPEQRRRVRELCAQFFEEGRAYPVAQRAAVAKQTDEDVVSSSIPPHA
jgi:hypothetical protein